MPLTKQQHLDPSHARKRILSLDGGGIRGVLTLEYLEVIEETLRKRYTNENLLLCDYFDLIGGTSTGSIIAAGLACGMSVAQIKKLYYDLGRQVFQTDTFAKLKLAGIIAPKFPTEPLRKALNVALGVDTTLDSDNIRTGLMIMTKRLDTGSPWPLNNGGGGTYAKQDGALRLAEVVRASTAAPTYFEPQEIKISSRDGDTVEGEFVDGGVSPFNDPALQLLMLAALDGHGFRWSTGQEHLLLISIGTGTYKNASASLFDSLAAGSGLRSLKSLMDDCARVNQTMLQWLTVCLTPWFVDRAVKDMAIDSQKGPKLATYVRYNVLLERDWLTKNLAVDYSPEQLAEIAQMDDPSNMDDLAKLGESAAARQVKEGHLPAAFDIVWAKAERGLTQGSGAAHGRAERLVATQGCAVQRPHDRRARPRKAAVSAG